MDTQIKLQAVFLKARSIIEATHDITINAGRPSSAPASLVSYMISIGDMLDHSNTRLIASLKPDTNMYFVNWGEPAAADDNDQTIQISKDDLTVSWLVDFIESKLL